MAEKKTSAKAEKVDYGEIDARWNAYRDGGLYYTLELEDGTVVVQTPGGTRKEESSEDFLARGLVPVSPTKSH